MPQIVRPGNWESVPVTAFGVIASGLDDRFDYTCFLMTAEKFFAGVRHDSDPIGRCGLVKLKDDLWCGTFDCAKARGECVIVIVDASANLAVHVQGLVVGVSKQTHLVRSGEKNETLSLIFPLSVVRPSSSNFNIPNSIEIEMDEIQPWDYIVNNNFGLRQVQKILYSPKVHDAKSALMLDACIGVERTAFKEEFNRSGWRSGYGYLAMLLDTTVYLSTGAVVSKDGIWLDSAFAGMLVDPAMTHYPDMFRYDNIYGRLDTGRGVKPTIEGPVFLLSNPGLGNFGHWMLNCLYSAFLMKEEIERSGGKIMSPQLPFFARESLQLLGLQDRLCESDEKIVQCQQLIFASPLSTHANMYPSEKVVEFSYVLKAAARKHPLFYRVAKPPFLFLTRLGFPSGRNMSNEDDLRRRLVALDFVMIATHELSMVEKLAAFSEAKIIISQMGAALSHMLFAPTGCIVVEITTERFHSNEFWYLASLLGHRYVRFMLPETEGTYESGSRFDFEIPVDLAVERVAALQRMVQDVETQHSI